MFGENLKTLRKQKGFSQEELATRLHVVRQTISKWEKNLSVPDADTLIRLAEILEVSVSELLGAKIENENTASDVAEQLSRINEQLAIKNRRSRRIWKTAVSDKKTPSPTLFRLAWKGLTVYCSIDSEFSCSYGEESAGASPAGTSNHHPLSSFSLPQRSKEEKEKENRGFILQDSTDNGTETDCRK